MALRTLFVLACVLAVCAAQSCISLGGSLLSTCSDELDVLQKIYPLDSSELPTSEQLSEITEAASAKSLPTSGCCSAAQTFDGASCQCDSTLPTLLGTLGLETSEMGLQGVMNITRTLCNFSGADC